ncbi:hypothetical protein RJT34_17034 [Clitoria ternatea]|uniref:Uncharacterized protein n=1 Tax=Clitoria ternatea TaxID=43366 RepID=A0AAN9J9U2_CLITE
MLGEHVVSFLFYWLNLFIMYKLKIYVKILLLDAEMIAVALDEFSKKRLEFYEVVAMPNASDNVGGSRFMRKRHGQRGRHSCKGEVQLPQTYASATYLA